MKGSPFRQALGKSLGDLDPLVRDHFDMPEGPRLYRGVMHRVWRRRGLLGALSEPILRLASRTDTLFLETGTDVPFELYHRVSCSGHDVSSMIWARTFRFPNVTRRFDAVMVYSRERGCLVDWLGVDGRLEVELHPAVQGGGLRICSGRQWLRVGAHKLALPRWLVGRADVLEQVRPDGSLAIRVAVENPILGRFMGYEGTFAHVEKAEGDGVRDSVQVPSEAQEISLGRWMLLALAALLGTVAYAFSFRVLETELIGSFAKSVGVSAGISWVVFIAGLAAISLRKPGLLEWVGLCLRTMTIGIAILALAVAFNLSPLSRSLEPLRVWQVHLIILGTSDIAMAMYFAHGSRARGVGILPALTVWGFGLNGTFALVLWMIWSP